MKRHLIIVALFSILTSGTAFAGVEPPDGTMIITGALAAGSGFQPAAGDVVSAVNVATGAVEATGTYGGGSYGLFVTKPASFNGTQITFRLTHLNTTYKLLFKTGGEAIIQFNGSFLPVQLKLNLLTSNTGVTGTGSATQPVTLTSTNSMGNTHGIEIFDNRTVLSGGAHSTSLTLDDNGATFRDVQTGAPVRVMGIADGVGEFDAVNLRQLNDVKRGIAATNAIANIPQVESGKVFALGIGIGGFDGQSALAVGASLRFAPSAMLKASVGGVNGGKASYGVGAAISW